MTATKWLSSHKQTHCITGRRLVSTYDAVANMYSNVVQEAATELTGAAAVCEYV
jgi:hypothetical protein